MQKLFRSVVLLIFLLKPMPAFSQGTYRLSSLEVDLWPEYDHPSVLVIYRAMLASDISLPADLTFRIPVEAGAPNAVAIRQPDGQLFSVDYSTQISGAWELITFTTTLPEIQLEYYDPGLQQEGGQKSYIYTWPGDYDVAKMSMQIQLPVEATNMQITPGPVSQLTGGDGMTYFTKEIGSTMKDQSFSIEVKYQKESTRLSVETLQVQPSAPLSPETTWKEQLHATLPWLFTEDGSTYEILPWILGGLALVLIFGGGYWYWRTGRQEQMPKRRKRGKSSKASEEGSAPETGTVYCHQCGKRANPGDSFCRSCGTRLRVE